MTYGMTTFLEEVLRVVVGLVALVGLWWVSVDIRNRRQLAEREENKAPKQ